MSEILQSIDTAIAYAYGHGRRDGFLRGVAVGVFAALICVLLIIAVVRYFQWLK